ncbi:hypothetical protein N431DRAFT_428996 [Stipitochalara longipes BDJ]|nr:hypothetical protein N431DRAFT_428996 [Stipitochalara longipes BDJ]
MRRSSPASYTLSPCANGLPNPNMGKEMIYLSLVSRHETTLFRLIASVDILGIISKLAAASTLLFYILRADETK